MHTVKERIDILRKVINTYRSEYHNSESPQDISQDILDSLMHELVLLEREYPEFLTVNSPSQRVEGVISPRLSKVRHSLRMISLNDVFSFDELMQWEDRNYGVKQGAYDYFVELKLDGLALSVVYQKSVLLYTVTRGNGEEGENVSHNTWYIQDIPSVLNGDMKHVVAQCNQYREGWGEEFQRLWNGNVEIRGEVFMKYSAFHKLNKEMAEAGKKEFANTRNVVAGILRQVKPNQAIASKLSFFAWALASDLGQRTQQEEYLLLQWLGVPVVPHNRYASNLSEVEMIYQEFYRTRDEKDFAYDGSVVKVNSKELQSQLGMTGKGPRSMIAYKFPAEQVVTEVMDIIVQVGRTGKITPVAILKPVNVYGVMVSRVTLHNQDEINRLDIRIGDHVVVHRAGDVIPEIVRVLPELRLGSESLFHLPTRCPRCDTILEQEQGVVNWFCPNIHCPARNIKYLTHFVSKEGFNIVGLSEGILERLGENGLINDELDIFTLQENDLMVVEGFQKKSTHNLLKSIEQSKNISFSRFIQSLGIMTIGSETAKALAHHFSSIEDLMYASQKDLQEIPDIGEVSSRYIYDYFHNATNIYKIKALQNMGITIIYPPLSITQGFFSGKTVVITGSFEKVNREDLTNILEQQQAHVSSQVSKKTHYVIVGRDPGSKSKKAQSLGISMISELELYDILNIS